VSDERIMGYEAIAEAIGKVLKQPVSPRTARRWARTPGRLRPRLPVYILPNGRAYVTQQAVTVFAAAYLAAMPAGAKEPGEHAA